MLRDFEFYRFSIVGIVLTASHAKGKVPVIVTRETIAKLARRRGMIVAAKDMARELIERNKGMIEAIASRKFNPERDDSVVILESDVGEEASTTVAAHELHFAVV